VLFGSCGSALFRENNQQGRSSAADEE
jgi:hypothetical protein